MPDEVLPFLLAGAQSRVTATVELAALSIEGSTRRQRLVNAVDYVWTHFVYDNKLGDKAFARTADELFFSRKLGGCSDFALAQATLFRALGIPAQLVVTANERWMTAYRNNRLLIPNGHVFIEAYLEDRWYLIDSTYRLIFPNYQPGSNHYPRGEFLVQRCRDFWEKGIFRVEDVEILFKNFALSFQPSPAADVIHSGVAI